MPPKVLVANRGEIAIRILRAAFELGWLTVALYTDNDASHATYADEAVKLASVADYLDVKTIVNIAYSTQCTHLHPGYGFLSESPALAIALSEASQLSGKPNVTFIGPSPSTLRIASDKMLSRDLAISLGVPVAPGKHVSSAESVKAFAHEIQVNSTGEMGYPLMIKALDGGGGRGIRVAHHESAVDDAFKRCLGESPSKQVFVEKALTGPGWKHVEVQVIGDGVTLNHFWERECSVQRRFQKIVEIAPSRLPRLAIQPIIDASLKMARHLRYKGLGTFEFLVNAQSPTSNWVFLEINPRVQVEHTITEEVNNVDLVRAQLLLFSSPSTNLASLFLATPPTPPTSFAIQLRLTAEDPSRGFQLSPGVLRAKDISWPAGRGMRVDTWLSSRPCTYSDAGAGGSSSGEEEEEWQVGTEFDSLLAKIILRGSTFEEATKKGVRALSELRLSSAIRTNVAVLAGTLLHPHWTGAASGIDSVGEEIDTLWLERNLDDVIRLGEEAVVSGSQDGKRRVVLGLSRSQNPNQSVQSTGKGDVGAGGGNAGVLLQPGSLFHLTLEAPKEGGDVGSASSNSNRGSGSGNIKHSITLTSIGQNAFPSVLSGTFLSSFPSPFSPSASTSSSSGPSRPIAFTLTQSVSANLSSNDQFELADPNAPGHVSSPMTGKIVELHPALVQAQKAANAKMKTNAQQLTVRKGDPLIVLSVMKMENVVAAPCDGYVRRVGKGVRVGVVLGESMLVCIIGVDYDEGGASRDKARL